MARAKKSTAAPKAKTTSSRAKKAAPESSYSDAVLSTAQSTVRKATKVVSDNASGKNAFFALLGVGALAFVSTETGRGLLKSAAGYLTTLAEDAMASASGHSNSEDSDRNENRVS